MIYINFFDEVGRSTRRWEGSECGVMEEGVQVELYVPSLKKPLGQTKIGGVWVRGVGGWGREKGRMYRGWVQYRITVHMTEGGNRKCKLYNNKY